jgi:hypothetical protein
MKFNAGTYAGSILEMLFWLAGGNLEAIRGREGWIEGRNIGWINFFGPTFVSLTYLDFPLS